MSVRIFCWDLREVDFLRSCCLGLGSHETSPQNRGRDSKFMNMRARMLFFVHSHCSVVKQ
jgi:hypothetical protein